MKKSTRKLARSAIGVACCFSGLAHGQANVIVYGELDVGVARFSNVGMNGNGAVTSLYSGLNNPSYLGFKGVESLGNGIETFFVLESGVAVTSGGLANGNGNLWGRLANLGVSGPLGSLTIGLQLDPYLLSVILTDPRGLSGAGSAFNTYAGSATYGILNSKIGSTPIVGIRDSNAIGYTTPTIGGFQATILYGIGEVAGNASAGAYLSANAFYDKGPVFLTSAYFQGNDNAGVKVAKNMRVGAGYSFNPGVKINLSYDVRKKPSTGESVDEIGGGTSGLISPQLSYSMGAYRSENRENRSDRATTYAAGLTYFLSKRTSLYGAISRLKMATARSRRTLSAWVRSPDYWQTASFQMVPASV
ncbi:MAG: porin [Pseudomonadota bacterium]